MKIIDYIIIAAILGCMFLGYSGFRIYDNDEPIADALFTYIEQHQHEIPYVGCSRQRRSCAEVSFSSPRTRRA